MQDASGAGADWIASGHVTRLDPGWPGTWKGIGEEDTDQRRRRAESSIGKGCQAAIDVPSDPQRSAHGRLPSCSRLPLVTTTCLSPPCLCASTLVPSPGFPTPLPMALSDIPAKPLPPPAKDEKLPSLPPLDFDDPSAPPPPPPKIVHDLAAEPPPQTPQKHLAPIDVKASLAASELCMCFPRNVSFLPP